MRMYKRHDRSDIFIHWFNAVCWFLLLVTGVGLIHNSALNPFGDAFPQVLRGMVGGGGNLLLVHEIIGVAWIFGFVGYILVNPRGAACFLREVFAVSPDRDMPWMFRKLVLMTLGEKALKAMGQPSALPPQGYYNMGQKGFGQVSVIGGIVIAVTGVIMLLSDVYFTADATVAVSWAVTLHYLAVGVVFAGLLVHIYMAAISPDERPGFRSMFTGSVPEEYAKHHHRLWYEREKARAADGE
jgi:formate dehydrogenase subunit gamma